MWRLDANPLGIGKILPSRGLGIKQEAGEIRIAFGCLIQPGISRGRRAGAAAAQGRTQVNCVEIKFWRFAFQHARMPEGQRRISEVYAARIERRHLRKEVGSFHVATQIVVDLLQPIGITIIELNLIPDGCSIAMRRNGEINS